MIHIKSGTLVHIPASSAKVPTHSLTNILSSLTPLHYILTLILVQTDLSSIKKVCLIQMGQCPSITWITYSLMREQDQNYHWPLPFKLSFSLPHLHANFPLSLFPFQSHYSTLYLLASPPSPLQHIHFLLFLASIIIFYEYKAIYFWQF